MKIKSGFVLQEVGNSYIAVAEGERSDSFLGLIKLNSTGAFYWNIMAERDVTEDELVSLALSAYEGVSDADIRPGLRALIKTLSDGGILE